MEHIVQFAVGIDDRAIAENVSKNAEKEIIKDLQRQVTNKLFRAYNSYRDADPKYDPLSEFSKGIVRDFLEENKDNIIKQAAKVLADSLARSKAGKAILTDLEKEN